MLPRATDRCGSGELPSRREIVWPEMLRSRAGLGEQGRSLLEDPGEAGRWRIRRRREAVSVRVVSSAHAARRSVERSDDHIGCGRGGLMNLEGVGDPYEVDRHPAELFRVRHGVAEGSMESLEGLRRHDPAILLSLESVEEGCNQGVQGLSRHEVIFPSHRSLRGPVIRVRRQSSAACGGAFRKESSRPAIRSPSVRRCSWIGAGVPWARAAVG